MTQEEFNTLSVGDIVYAQSGFNLEIVGLTVDEVHFTAPSKTGLKVYEVHFQNFGYVHHISFATKGHIKSLGRPRKSHD